MKTHRQQPNRECVRRDRFHSDRFHSRYRPVTLAALLGLLLVLLLTLSACGGESGGEVKTYTHATYGCSFNYPASWKVQEGGTADVQAGNSAAANVGVYDPEGAVAESTYIDMIRISIYELNVTIDKSMMADVKTEVEQVLASIESQAGDIKTLEPLAETKVSGMDGYTVTYSFAKNGAPVNSTLYFLFSGDIEYQMTVQASVDNWEADQAVFKDIIDSFKPGS